MMPMLADLVAMLDRLGVAAAFVFLRVGAALAVLPAFGEQSVPVRVRLGLALALTALVFPIEASAIQARGLALTPLTGGAEIANGLILGFVFRLFVMALQIAGMIAASATSLAQIFGGGVTVDPQPAISNLLVVAGLALATMGGLHVKLVEAFVLTYALLPLGVWPVAVDVIGWAMRDVAQAFALGFALAAPFTIAGLLYNLALGVINKAMPQLMVAFVGAPALTLGGLILLALSLPFALEHWADALDARLLDPLGTGR